MEANILEGVEVDTLENILEGVEDTTTEGTMVVGMLLAVHIAQSRSQSKIKRPVKVIMVEDGGLPETMEVVMEMVEDIEADTMAAILEIMDTTLVGTTVVEATSGLMEVIHTGVKYYVPSLILKIFWM